MTALHPQGLHITYVESSEKMMARAKERDSGKNPVSYILCPIENFCSGEKYDCILTGFFFDNFSPEHAHTILLRLDRFLKKDGYWCYADFRYTNGGKLWQRVLLQSMYIAARIICRVQARRLPDMEPLFAAAGYEPVFTGLHYQGMIKSILYKK